MALVVVLSQSLMPNHALSEKFTLKIRSESRKLFTNGCHFPPKSTNFGTLDLEGVGRTGGDTALEL